MGNRFDKIEIKGKTYIRKKVDKPDQEGTQIFWPEEITIEKRIEMVTTYARKLRRCPKIRNGGFNAWNCSHLLDY